MKHESIESLRAEIARLRPVVDAAVVWRVVRGGDATRQLQRVTDAYRAKLADFEDPAWP